MHRAGVIRLFRYGLLEVHRICGRRSQCCCCTSVGHNKSERDRARQTLNTHNRLHNLLKIYVNVFKTSCWNQAAVSSALLTLRNLCSPTGITIFSGTGMPGQPRPILQAQVAGLSCLCRGMHTGNDLLMWHPDKVNHNSCMLIGSPLYQTTHIRQMSKGRKKAKSQQETEDESSDEELSEWMESLEEEESEDTAGAPNNFTQVKVHMKALRADAVASAGLNMARNKVDDLFYKSKLLLNGEKLLKKSFKMDVGEFVDVVTGTKDNETMVKRVQIVKIMKEKTKTDKLIVILRVWKSEFPVSTEDTDV
ncbi:uncharacterized protein LOC135461472 [Liolophura sinensis]|uniref:uncharacterized protein LOC135461472 n=1 Tax=Liolophura sinensis TaxID=3198878 RepID=UPI003158082E